MMETLERVWEFIGLVFSGLLGGVERGITYVFRSANERYIRRLRPTIAAINALERKYQALPDRELRGNGQVP